MRYDIDDVLARWDYKPGAIQARLIEAEDNRQVIQMRIDLGVMQMEVADRPDGKKPHGFATYFDYLRKLARQAGKRGKTFTIDEEQGSEADREFMQYYHRRVCWIVLRNFGKAVADADHTLKFMDFCRDHSPGDEFTMAHEQYRPFVIFHRTQAAAAEAAEAGDAGKAVKAIHVGLESIREFYERYEQDERYEEDPMVQQLQKLEETLRETHTIPDSLEDQLAKAVANEEYEVAARLRDELREQQQGR